MPRTSFCMPPSQRGRLHRRIWSEQIYRKPSAQTLPAEEVLFTLRAGSKYGARLNALANALQVSGVEAPSLAEVTDKQLFRSEVISQFYDMTKRSLRDTEQSGGKAEMRIHEKYFEDAVNEIQKVATETLGAEAQTIFGKDRFGSVPEQIGDQNSISPPPSNQPAGKIVRPDEAVRWCFATAGVALDAAKRDLSARFKQEQGP